MVLTNQQNNAPYKANNQTNKGQFAECQRVDAARLEGSREQRAVVDNWALPGAFWLCVVKVCGMNRRGKKNMRP